MPGDGNRSSPSCLLPAPRTAAGDCSRGQQPWQPAVCARQAGRRQGHRQGRGALSWACAPQGAAAAAGLCGSQGVCLGAGDRRWWHRWVCQHVPRAVHGQTDVAGDSWMLCSRVLVQQRPIELQLPTALGIRVCVSDTTSPKPSQRAGSLWHHVPYRRLGFSLGGPGCMPRRVGMLTGFGQLPLGWRQELRRGILWVANAGLRWGSVCKACAQAARRAGYQQGCVGGIRQSCAHCGHPLMSSISSGSSLCPRTPGISKWAPWRHLAGPPPARPAESRPSSR